VKWYRLVLRAIKICWRSLIHADQHGAVIIPDTVIPALAEAIRQLLETEKLILERARVQHVDFNAFEKVWSAFEEART